MNHDRQILLAFGIQCIAGIGQCHFRHAADSGYGVLEIVGNDVGETLQLVVPSLDLFRHRVKGLDENADLIFCFRLQAGRKIAHRNPFCHMHQPQERTRNPIHR